MTVSPTATRAEVFSHSVSNSTEFASKGGLCKPARCRSEMMSPGTVAGMPTMPRPTLAAVHAPPSSEVGGAGPAMGVSPKWRTPDGAAAPLHVAPARTWAQGSSVGAPRLR